MATALEETVLGMLEKNHTISPALLQTKLRLTSERAEELCLWAWNQRAKYFFSFRTSGLGLEDFEKGDRFDG